MRLCGVCHYLSRQTQNSTGNITAFIYSFYCAKIKQNGETSLHVCNEFNYYCSFLSESEVPDPWPSGTWSLTIRNTEPHLFQCCARYSNIYHGLIHGTDLYGHLGNSEKGSAGLSTSRHLTRSGKSSYASQHRPIFRLPVGHHPGIECSIDEITQLFIAGWFPAFKFHKRYSNSAYDDH